jgi:hypothetical protein
MKEIPTTQKAGTLEEQFRALLDNWRADTAYLSSSTQITEHPAYQEIISLGRPVLPLLFRELERTHDGHLSKALVRITGAHPIPVEDRGKIQKIAEIWLRWARENGYSW